MANTPKTLDRAKCREIGRSCACYSLRRAARAITRLYDDFLRPSGLRVTQFSVLNATMLHGPVPLTKLAEMTVTERTTLTRNLTILEKKGLRPFLLTLRRIVGIWAEMKIRPELQFEAAPVKKII